MNLQSEDKAAKVAGNAKGNNFEGAALQAMHGRDPILQSAAPSEASPSKQSSNRLTAKLQSQPAYRVAESLNTLENSPHRNLESEFSGVKEG